MNIVIAPDSYKGSLTALEVATTMKKAIVDLGTDEHVVIKPMADGGEGTLDALLASSNGKRIPVKCSGPLGDTIETEYAVTIDGTVIIETAITAGLIQVPEDKRNPNRTTTFGMGQVILDAMERGYTSFVIGLGGSATNDGGLGMLQALGMKAWDKTGREVGSFGSDLIDLCELSLSGLDQRIRDVEIRVACDVDSPLCGPRGASVVYGPQKGATADQVETFDYALNNYASLIEAEIDRSYRNVEGAGAAGGLGFAFLALGGKIESGAKLLADASKIESEISKADLVITGEGKSDDQTLYGKAPAYIADLAGKYGIPTILISGSLGGDLNALRSKFSGCFSIINKPLSLGECIEQAEQLVYEQTKQVIHLASSIYDGATRKA